MIKCQSCMIKKEKKQTIKSKNWATYMWVLAGSSYLSALNAGLLDKKWNWFWGLKPQKSEMQSNEKAVVQEVAGWFKQQFIEVALD